MALQNAFGNLALDATIVSSNTKLDSIITALGNLQTELNQKLEAGQSVALDAGTLAALETITASISNFPSDYPDAATLAKVEAVRALLAGTLTISGAVTVASTTNGTQKSQIIDAAGDVVDVVTLGTQVTTSEKGLVTNSVIHGKTTAGGGSYVDVKVTPSGALSTETTITDSALPTGASTAAKQDTGNDSLSNIDTNIGAKADAAASSDTGTFSVISFIKRSLQNWTSLLAKIPSLLNGYFPVTVAAQYFPVSTDNVTSVQLASGSEYTGNIEDVKNLQSAQLSINCDQPYRVTIIQYRDLAGTEEVSSDVLYKGAGEEINENINLPGDYFHVKVKNLGPVATTTFKLSTTFGMMPVTPRVLGTNPNGRTDQALPVRAIPQTIFRTTFAKVLASTWDTNFWVRVFQGTGMANTQSAGNGVITTGTTANQETILRSTKPFIGSFLLRAKTILSQRIANNNFFVELVDIIGDNLVITVNSSTSVTVTIPNNPFTSENVGQSMYIGALTGFTGVTSVSNRYAIASVSGNDVNFTVAGWATGADNVGTCSLFGWNYHQLLYDSTTATQAKYDTQRNGWNNGTTTATISTSASPGHMAIMGSEDGNAFLSDQLVASTTGIPIVPRATRVLNIAEENTPLFLQIRAVNGTTNPASTTTWTIGTISVENYAAQQVTIANSKAQGPNAAASVQVQSLPTLANVTTVATVTTLSQFVASAAGADATANPTTTGVRGFGYLYNGSTWDRARNNVEATLLASAARTTTQTSADITTYDAKKLIVVLDMTSVGTGSVTVSIDGKDSASGKYYNILTGVAITTNSTNRYRVGETLAAVANSVAQDYLPRVIRIVVTANNANSATYSVGYVLGL